MIEEIIDRESLQKLYVQMYSILKAKIEKGEWHSGTQIPTEDDLAKIFNVSKATVRMAMSELARDGYIKKQQGKGTFVSHSTPYPGMTMRTQLIEDMFGEGVKINRELLVKGINEPPDDIKTYLKAVDNIYYILYKKNVEDEPAYIEELFVPTAIFPGIEKEDISQTSFYDLIQENAIRKIFKIVQTIEVTEIKGDAAVILKVKEGSPGLLLHRLLIGSDGTPIAYTRLFGSGVKYKIQTEFERIR